MIVGEVWHRWNGRPWQNAADERVRNPIKVMVLLTNQNKQIVSGRKQHTVFVPYLSINY